MSPITIQAIIPPGRRESCAHRRFILVLLM
jgi:hypothetical protein